MQLSYEEVMARIEEYKKTNLIERQYCTEKEFPWFIYIYQGENQIIVVPCVTTIGWYAAEMAWYRQITDLQNAQLVGGTVLEAVEHVRVSPVDARTRAESDADDFRGKVSKYKAWKTFDKHYLQCVVLYREDGSYLVGPGGHNEINTIYPRDENTVPLPAGSTAEDIGATILSRFALMEDFYNALKGKPPALPRASFQTLSDSMVSFEEPQGDNYTDGQDYHAAEIYQGYSYSKEGAEESIADLYFGIAPELECDISPENIQRVYQSRYGQDAQIVIEEISHPVFTLRVEAIGKIIHHIAYLRQIDDTELLSCELEVKIKPAGKRIYAKVLKDYERMVKNCRLES